MVRRNLHDKGSSLTFQQGMLKNQTGQHGKADTDQIEEKHQILTTDREKCRRKKGIHRQPGTAGHKGVHHDCQGSVPFIFQGPGGHDRRDIAAETDEHRHEGFAGKADKPH